MIANVTCVSVFVSWIEAALVIPLNAIYRVHRAASSAECVQSELFDLVHVSRPADCASVRSWRLSTRPNSAVVVYMDE